MCAPSSMQTKDGHDLTGHLLEPTRPMTLPSKWPVLFLWCIHENSRERGRGIKAHQASRREGTEIDGSMMICCQTTHRQSCYLWSRTWRASVERRGPTANLLFSSSSPKLSRSCSSQSSSDCPRSSSSPESDPMLADINCRNVDVVCFFLQY